MISRWSNASQRSIPVVGATAIAVRRRRRLICALVLCTVMLNVAQRLIDNLSQDVRLTVLLQPRQHPARQLGEIVHGQQFERLEHLIGDCLELKVRHAKMRTSPSSAAFY